MTLFVMHHNYWKNFVTYRKTAYGNSPNISVRQITKSNSLLT